ncbi:MAG: ethylbenzene dehydrogenase-related protein, partial [bacterium]
CHGMKGKGNGPAAEYLFPKPRDFTSGIYKFTSTPNGKLPTDKDIERVVREGLSPGGMPGFDNSLSDKQIQNVSDYVKTFSDKFKKQDVPEPVNVPEPPEDLMAESRVKKGKKLYGKLCATCHGKNGKGNGPAASTQKDHWGEPLPPRDLTQGQYKAGGEIKDLYWRIVTGINGTGMPPFKQVLSTPEQRWAMIAYVRSLREDTGPAVSGETKGTLLAKRVDVSQKSLKDPASPVWETSNRTRKSLYSLWLTDRTPFDSVEVRALHNGNRLALRLSWNDPTANVKPIGQTEFTDGTAVMFPDVKGAVPFIGMGDQNMEGGVAHIWHWRAMDQFAVDRGGTTVDMEDKYPYMDITYYKNKEDYKPGTSAKYEKGHQHTSNQPRKYQTAWAVNNPLAKQTLDRPVRSYRAEGLGSLTALKKKKMRVDGDGHYQDGQWQVVITRPLKTQTRVVQFEPGETHKAAFAVWDGEQNDRNGQKDITSWISLKL